MKQQKILFIFNSADQRGAPLVLLDFIKEFKKRNPNISFNIISQENGSLIPELEKLAPTVVFKYKSTYKNKILQKLIDIKKYIFSKNYRRFINIVNQNYQIVISNTVYNYETLYFRRNKKDNLIVYMHEYKEALLRNPSAIKNLQKVSKIISVSNCAGQNIIDNYGIDKNKVIYAHNSINKNFLNYEKREILSEIIKDKTVVLRVGNVDVWGKGADLFLSIAQNIQKENINNIIFIWIGGSKSNFEFNRFERDIIKMNLENFVYLFETVEDIQNFYSISDINLITSREDTFPMVALEAATMKKTILCFEQAGGASEILAPFPELIIPYCDVNAMTSKIKELHLDKTKCEKLGEKIYSHVSKTYIFEKSYKKIETEILKLK